MRLKKKARNEGNSSYLFTWAVSNLPKAEPALLPLQFMLSDSKTCQALLYWLEWCPLGPLEQLLMIREMPDEENLAAFSWEQPMLVRSAHGGGMPLTARVCNWSTRLGSSSLRSSPGTLIPSPKKVIDANMKLGVGWGGNAKEWTKRKITLVLNQTYSLITLPCRGTIKIIIFECYPLSKTEPLITQPHFPTFPKSDGNSIFPVVYRKTLGVISLSCPPKHTFSSPTNAIGSAFEVSPEPNRSLLSPPIPPSLS